MYTPSSTVTQFFFCICSPSTQQPKKNYSQVEKILEGHLRLFPLPPQITPVRNHLNVGMNIETKLACTVAIYVTSGAPAATHKVVHLRDFNTIYFVLVYQLNKSFS